MAPDTDASLIRDPCVLRQDLMVADIIYNPRRTKLMRQAEEAMCKSFGGLEMLLFQGEEAFRLWTGKQMPVELVKERFFS